MALLSPGGGGGGTRSTFASEHSAVAQLRLGSVSWASRKGLSWWGTFYAVGSVGTLFPAWPPPNAGFADSHKV